MTKISYIDIVRNVHIDWVTADLEQEATRKGSGTSKRGARVVSSKSRKTPILGVHCDSTLRDARANSESGRVPVGSVGPLPILKALAKVVRFATLSHSVSPLRVQVRPTLTPSRSWLCAWPARLAAAAAPTPILRLTSRRRPITRTVSARCNQSPWGIATVTLVLPSRPTDVEAGGSGAAEAWAGPPRRFGRVPRQRISARGDIMPLHQKH